MYYEGGFVGGIITGQVNKDGSSSAHDPTGSTSRAINGNNGVTIGGDVIAR